MKVHSIFQSINGEVCGPGQGSVCTFIRFQKCNLKCPYCDTPESQSAKGGKEYTKYGILNTIKTLPINTKNITITGGEPLLQKELDELIMLLDQHNYSTTIETNGSIKPSPTMKGLCCVVMDCKLPSSFAPLEKYALENYERYNKKFLENIKMLSYSDWVKFPIQTEEDFELALYNKSRCEEINEYMQFAFSAVHPLSSKKLLEWIFKKEIYDAVLNVQLHKVVGVP